MHSGRGTNLAPFCSKAMDEERALDVVSLDLSKVFHCVTQSSGGGQSQVLHPYSQ